MINVDKNKICQIGKQVISTELQAISELSERIDDTFVAACNLLLNCQGHIIVTGIGKSGHIGRKIAATFASTGSPAFFVHPGEASHGDLGMITKNNILIAISKSGNTAEILTILPILQRRKIPLICLTGNIKSSLAQQATVHLDISVVKEACPLGLAPTASTTAALVMGDALAITLLELRGFNQHDFALSHPGGILGKRLLLRIDDIMHIDKAIPKVQEKTLLRDALVEMTTKKLGMTAVVDDNEQLVGIFTDGDLRRTVDQNFNINAVTVGHVMTKNCKTILAGTLAIDALKLMEQHEITSLIVKNKQGNMVGIIHMHDILRTGIM